MLSASAFVGSWFLPRIPPLTTFPAWRDPARGLALLLLWCGPFLSGACGEDFAPGDQIEYQVRGSWPVQWAPGRIIRPLDGGKQYLIHEQPSEFFPEGPEVAFAPEKLRRPAPAPPQPQPDPEGKPQPEAPAPAEPDKPAAPVEPGPPAAAAPPAAPAAPAGALLSKADVLAYAQATFGAGDPFANPRRQELLDQIRDHIKARGTSFLPDLDFSNQMGALGAYSVHINSAIEANHGPAPKLEDYFGTFLLRVANRGSQSHTRDGSRVIVTTTDSQHESGQLTIHPDGTYVWQLQRGDPADKWLRGQWRAVKPAEMHLWEAGPALWLERAKQEQDYMVRGCRAPGYADWIDVGMGKGRTPVEYGRRAAQR